MKSLVVETKIDLGADGDAKISVEPTNAALDAVLFDFNPTSNAKVTAIKAMHAALIQMMRDVRDEGDPAKARVASTAITELEGTQMRCVKALFAKG